MDSKNGKKNCCYICLEIPKKPIYPSGCTHPLCRRHLKVKK